MKLSFHTIVVNDYPAKGEHLLYNTRTQAMVKIDQELKDILDNPSNEIDTLPSIQRNNIQQLHKMGIVVQDESEDFSRLRAHMQQLKYSYDDSCLGVTILTTYGCNFKCVYCFEESTRTNQKMDFSTQTRVIEWIKDRLLKGKYKGLYLNFYGGEPLLNPKAIDDISKSMVNWCSIHGVEFGFGLQTNGYLLTPTIVERFKKLGLTRVRISLDGVGEDHDRLRPLRNGGGTFGRIMQNIENSVGKIEIALSMGYSNNDIEPIKRLLDYLDERGILHKLGGQILFSPIVPTVGPKGNPEAIIGSDCMCNSNDKSLADSVRKIEALMKEKALPTKSGMSTSTCPLVRENGAVTIDQEGKLYRCNSLLGHPEFSVGDIFHEGFNEKHKEFRDLDVWQQCPQDCTYLPMCSGGCRLMSFVGGNKNFRVPSCKKPYLNEMAPEFIKRDYERMVAEKRKIDQSSHSHKKIAAVDS